VRQPGRGEYPSTQKIMEAPADVCAAAGSPCRGRYFYVTGGAVMSTDNAYVQADMVGLSTDVAGIVTQVMVHDNQEVTKGDILFKLEPLQFQLALDRAEAQIGNTRNDLVALQASYRNMQAQVEQAQEDVDFNMVNFKRQEQLLANNFTPRATFDAARNGPAPSTASAQHQRRAFRCCRPKIPAATGSRSCSGYRCVSALPMRPESYRCASA
jgi:membrane fusion protein, multidrug efflux system